MRKRLAKKRALTTALEELERLRQENAQLRRENAELKARLRELERRLLQNSSNSSKPPSSDQPSTPPRPPKPPTGRNPGAQPGHPGHQRPLVPAELVDKTIPVKPDQCGGCGAALSGDDPDPRRHQVAEIPKIKPHIT
jgi:transposase